VGRVTRKDQTGPKQTKEGSDTLPKERKVEHAIEKLPMERDRGTGKGKKKEKRKWCQQEDSQ